MSDPIVDGGWIVSGTRLLILSDIHGNWDALRAVLQVEPDATDILCLGDWVNYGPEPAACVRWGARHVRPGRALRGNHDIAAVTGALPRYSSAGRDELAETLRDTRRRLSPADRAFLASLPESVRLRTEAEVWWAGHALPSDPLEGYLRGDAPEAAWQGEIRRAGNPDVLLVGHTHRPFLRRVGSTLVVNPGSVGRPKGGEPAGSYAIWRDGVFCLRNIPTVVPIMDGLESKAEHGLCCQHVSASLRSCD